MSVDAQADIEDPAARFAADVKSAIAEGDLQRALDLSNRAISRGLRHPQFFLLRGRRSEAAGHLQFALEDYQRAAALAPDDAGAHEAVAACATKLGNYRPAAEAYSAILAIDWNRPDIHNQLGGALANLGESETAQRSHENAVQLDPQHVDSLASLALILARKGNGSEARDVAAKALAIDPRQPTAMVAMGQAYMADRLYVEAEKCFADLLAADILYAENRAPVLTLLGDALDAQKKYADAFPCYVQANEELRRQHAVGQGNNGAPEAARGLITYFENDRTERWSTPDQGGAVEGEFDQHVFLLGYMRSGTTLLEQVLASNPNIVALEEKGLLAQPGDEYLTSGGALETLATLSEVELTKLRKQYWRKVREYLPDATAKVFVDKQPLYTSKLPLIAKLFPKARILFAIRDPRDVVFSCFRRNFKVSGTQYEFLNIESCARIYSLIMRVGEVSREKCTLNVLEHRYEDMIEDFDGRIRAVCDFIGVEWAETMRRFDEHRSVADLRSPSALQVRRPLYKDGVGQWRRYAEQLKPVLPILEPWAVKFGYARD